MKAFPLVFYSGEPRYNISRANGFRAEIAVLRPEGVFPYVEWEETAIDQKRFSNRFWSVMPKYESPKF